MKRFLSFFVIAVALMAVLALSVCAEIISDDIYVSTNSGSSAKLAENIYYTSYESSKVNTVAPSREEAAKTGLIYSFDEETGVIIIDYADGYNSSNIINTWVLQYPESIAISDISEIIVNADIKSLPEKAFNYITKVTKITIPRSLKTIGGQSMARLYNLQCVKVDGSEYDDNLIFDFRYITSTSTNSFTDISSSLKGWSNESVISVLLNDKIVGNPNQYWGPHTDIPTTEEDRRPQSKLTFVFYVPEGKENAQFVDLVDKYIPWQKDYTCFNNFNTIVKTYPSSSLSHDGFQIRTENYNGLRGVFSFDSSVENEGFILKEFGTVAIPFTKDDVNYRITYDNETNEYIADSSCKAQIRPVWKDGKNANKPAKFYISIVNYGKVQNMKTPVFMTGYEVWENADGLRIILYTCEKEGAVAPQSLYDVTLGMYMKGLINHKDEQKITVNEENPYYYEGEFIYWSVLERCKLELEWAPDSDQTLNTGAEYSTNHSTDWKKYTLESGDLVDANGTRVSAFEKDDKIYLIAHAHTTIEDASGMTFSGGGEKAKYGSPEVEYKLNYLNYIQTDGKIKLELKSYTNSVAKVDTIVIDAGITRIEKYALSYLQVSNVLYNDDPETPLRSTTTIFGGGYSTIRIAPFSKTSSGKYVFDDFFRVADFSGFSIESVSWNMEFLQCPEYILPSVSAKKEATKVLGEGFISGRSSTYTINCLHAEGVDKSDRTIDLRNTLFYVNMVANQDKKYQMCTSSNAVKNIFKDVFGKKADGILVGALYLIQKEPDGYYYKYTLVSGETNLFTREEWTAAIN